MRVVFGPVETESLQLAATSRSPDPHLSLTLRTHQTRTPQTTPTPIYLASSSLDLPFPHPRPVEPPRLDTAGQSTRPRSESTTSRHVILHRPPDARSPAPPRLTPSSAQPTSPVPPRHSTLRSSALARRSDQAQSPAVTPHPPSVPLASVPPHRLANNAGRTQHLDDTAQRTNASCSSLTSPASTPQPPASHQAIHSPAPPNSPANPRANAADNAPRSQRDQPATLRPPQARPAPPPRSSTVRALASPITPANPRSPRPASATTPPSATTSLLARLLPRSQHRRHRQRQIAPLATPHQPAPPSA